MRLLPSSIDPCLRALSPSRLGRPADAPAPRPLSRRPLSLLVDRRAVTAVEYGLLAALIASALVASIKPFRQGMLREFGNIAGLMADDPTMK